jgi:hypothetical protein
LQHFHNCVQVLPKRGICFSRDLTKIVLFFKRDASEMEVSKRDLTEVGLFFKRDLPKKQGVFSKEIPHK